MIGHYTTRATVQSIMEMYLTVGDGCQNPSSIFVIRFIRNPNHGGIMPLGDPHGANFEYTTEGLPESIFVCTIPVKEVSRSIKFYTDILEMDVLLQNEDQAYMIRGDCRIVLKKSSVTGVDTGLYLGVDNPYNSRRRLVDEGVIFTQEPRRGPFGTFCSIRDDDANVIHLIETKADFQK